MLESKFDLQLFNEEGTGEQSTTNSPNNQSQVPEDNGEQGNNEPEIAIDENGNVVFNGDGILGTPGKQEQSNNDTKPLDQQQPQVYTPEEIKETPFDRLDPTRLPPEMQAYYKSMQSGFTKKSQELAEQKRQMEEQFQQQQAPQQQEQQEQQAQQNNPQEVQKQYYEQVFKIAKDNVEKIFGEDYDPYEPMHQTALADEITRINNFINQQQTKQQAFQQVVNKYSQLPEFKEIDEFASKTLDNLPFAQSWEIRQRLQSGDIQFIDKFMQEATNLYYKQVNGGQVQNPVQQQNPIPLQQMFPQQQQQQKIKPPFVESAGTGISTSNGAIEFDPKQLGKMTTDQQAKVFMDLGFTDL